MPPPLRLRGLHPRVRLRGRAAAVPPELRVRAPQEVPQQLPPPGGEGQGRERVVPDQEGVERGVPGADGLRGLVAVVVAGRGEVPGGGFLRRGQRDG